MVKIAGEPLVILLVEDNEAHAELVLRSMKDNRVANIIYFADDGEKALDFLFHRGPYKEMITSPRPNLILLDLRLPRVDGLDVLKTIKETPNLMQIPVVILTSSDAETDIARSYKYHANSLRCQTSRIQKVYPVNERYRRLLAGVEYGSSSRPG